MSDTQFIYRRPTPDSVVLPLQIRPVNREPVVLRMRLFMSRRPTTTWLALLLHFLLVLLLTWPVVTRLGAHLAGGHSDLWVYQWTLWWVKEALLRGESPLTFYWQALRAMDNSYKVSVHLLDGTIGNLMGQVDAVPQNWQYPTSSWRPGEQVEDTHTFSLAELPLTELQVWVGLYDETTGRWLSLSPAGGLPVQNDAVLLTTITR
jgi:hypothetical protein